MSIRTIDGAVDNNGYQQVTALSSAAALTVPAGTLLAVLQAEGADVRYRDDDTNPTSSVGMIIAAGTSVVYNGQLSRLRFIESGGTAKLNVSYYKVSR
jgi:hypothetical protein